MKIAIGSDHRGFEHKEFLQAQCPAPAWVDVGIDTDEYRSDYPLFAHAVCSLMQSGGVEKGVLLCATGIGMAITANRFAHIYAAVAWNPEIARLSVEHDNVNLLVIPSDFVSHDDGLAIVCAWLSAHFLGDRHAKRIALIDELGGVVDPRDRIP